MEDSSETLKPHCLVLSYPAQGHINPMLQFSRRLLHKGVKVTFVTTRSMTKTLRGSSSCTSIELEAISDGFDDGGIEAAGSFEAYFERFWKVGPETLSELVERLLSGKWIVCPGSFPGVFYHCQKGLLKVPVRKQVWLPGMPPLEPEELPSFACDVALYPAFFHEILNQFSNLDRVDWVLCNAVYELEQETADWFMKILPFRTIGPTVPSTYLDNKIEQVKEYGLNILKPDHDTTMKWLSTKPKGSVVYVSFGSIAELAIDQMRELAMGLKKSNCYFLWVLRPSETEKLPQGFANGTGTSQKGLIVAWCRQLEVLSHKALGLFVTHCGWNYTLEALSLGVVMLAMPQWADQITNAKYVMDMWRTGLRPPVDKEKGLVGSEEIERWIRELMEGQRGKEARENARKWKRIAREAVGEGGSSDRNIDEFIVKLAGKTAKKEEKC